MNMLSKSKKYGLAAAISGVMLLGVSTTASAQWAVYVTNCISQTSITGVVPNCASEATVAEQFNYLSTGQTLSPTALMGEGVIALLRKQNDSNAQSVVGDVQSLPNEDLGNRQRDYSLKTRDMIAEVYTPVTEGACRNASRNAGSLGGGGGGGPGAGQPKLDTEQEKRMLKPTTPDTALGNLVGGDQKNSCTQDDLDNKMTNCETVGQTPGANTRFQSLLWSWDANPTKRTRTIESTGLSRTAAETYIILNSPRNAPNIPEGMKSQVNGKKYLAYQRKYHASALAVSNFYNRSLDLSFERPGNDPFVTQVWNTGLKDEYQQVYPGRNPPASPSYREIMHMFVDRQFSKKVIAEDLAGKGDEAYLASRNLEMQKINAFLLLQLHEQLEYNGMLQAQALQQQIDPVTYKEVEALAGSE